MRLEDYNLLENKVYSVLNPKGQVENVDEIPKLSDDELLRIYKLMLFTRTIDDRALSYQRQGRMLTYAPNSGQEAAQIGSAFPMEKDDFLVPAFRELGAWLTRGAPLKNIYLYWYGNEWGSHYPEDVRVLPVSVPIASQMQHAVGIGMANNIKGEKNVAVTYVGDGGTSQGDFHESLNFAAVYKAPVVFIIQNNQYAISTSRKIQTMSKNLAQKAVAYGMPGIVVDGNDIFAMYNASKVAIDRARNGEGPTLIEAHTYRLGAHTTSDDPTKYRDDAEVAEWQEKNPITRFSLYLKAKRILTDEWEEKTLKELDDEVKNTFEEIEDNSDTKLEDIFKYQYATMTDQLQEQLDEYRAFLEGGK
jgi:pyruvate dehydrogenase E1 component alpha subunit